MIYPIKTKYPNLVGVSKGLQFWSPAPISFVNIHLSEDRWWSEDVSPKTILTTRVVRAIQKIANPSSIMLDGIYAIQVDSSEMSPHALLTEVLKILGHKGAVCQDDTRERALEVQMWFKVVMMGYDLHNLMCAAALTKNQDRPPGVDPNISWASLSTASVRDLCLSPSISRKYLSTVINRTLHYPGWWDHLDP